MYRKHTIELLFFLFILNNHATCQATNNLFFINLKDATKQYAKCKKLEDIRTDHCHRCKSWSIEFRRKNTCPGCRNYGTKIGTRTCSVCKGKGKKIDWGETEKKFIKENNKFKKGDIIFYAGRFFEEKPLKTQLIGGVRMGVIDNMQGIERMEISTFDNYDNNGNKVKIKQLKKAYYEPQIKSIRELNFIVNQLYPGYQIANKEEITSFLLGDKQHPIPIKAMYGKFLVTDYEYTNTGYGLKFAYIGLFSSSGNHRWGHLKGRIKEYGLEKSLKKGLSSYKWSKPNEYGSLILIRKKKSNPRKIKNQSEYSRLNIDFTKTHENTNGITFRESKDIQHPLRGKGNCVGFDAVSYPACDIVANKGTALFAPHSGSFSVIDDPTCGNGIKLTKISKSGDTIISEFCHLRSRELTTFARKGSLIGFTGGAFGEPGCGKIRLKNRPHVTWYCEINGNPKNPFLGEVFTK